MHFHILVSSSDLVSLLGRTATILLSHADTWIHQALQAEIKARYWYPYPICSGYECRLRHIDEVFGTSMDTDWHRPISREVPLPSGQDRTIRRRIRGKCSLESIIRAEHQSYLADIYDLVYVMDLPIFLVDRSVVTLAHVNGVIHWALRSDLRRIRAGWVIRSYPAPLSPALDRAGGIPANLCTGYELRLRHLRQITECNPCPRRRIRHKCSPDL